MSTWGSVRVAAFLRVSIVICSFRGISARIASIKNGEMYLNLVRALSVS